MLKFNYINPFLEDFELKMFEEIAIVQTVKNNVLDVHE
jgi:hypothetical protein